MFEYSCRDILRAALLTPGIDGRWGLPINFEGDPGASKTAQIKSICREIGLYTEVVSLGTRDPADLLGYGVPQEDGFMRYYASDFVRRANQADGAVIYLDEWNHGSPSVQGAAQRLISEGWAGAELAESVRFVMSMNPTDQATSAGGSDLSMALANRVGHLRWQNPTASDWSRYIQAPDAATPEIGDVIDQESRVLAAWPVAYAKAAAAVTTFIRSNPSALHRVPAANSPHASKPWPSPRTWELAIRALASADVHGLDAESRLAFAGSFVGDSAISEFQVWESENELPDPIDILDGRHAFTHDPSRLDVTMAVLSACAGILTPEPRNDKDKQVRTRRAEVFWETVAEVVESAPDLAIDSVSAILRARGGLGRVSGTSKKVMAKMHALLSLSV